MPRSCAGTPRQPRTKAGARPGRDVRGGAARPRGPAALAGSCAALTASRRRASRGMSRDDSIDRSWRRYPKQEASHAYRGTSARSSGHEETRMHADLVNSWTSSPRTRVEEVERRSRGPGARRPRWTRPQAGRATCETARTRRGRRRRAGGRAGGEGGELPGAAGAPASAAGARSGTRRRPRRLMAELDLGPLGAGQGGDRMGPKRRGGRPARARRSARRQTQGRGGRGGAGARAGRARRAARGARGRARAAVARSARRAPGSSTGRSAPATTGCDNSRARDVVVPLSGGACGACYTAVPINRRSQIRSRRLLDGCEVCGAILYPPDAGRDGMMHAPE